MMIKSINEKIKKLLYYPGDDAETQEVKFTFFMWSASVVPPVIGLTILTRILDVPVLELYGYLLIGYYTLSLGLFLIIRRHVVPFYYVNSISVMLMTFYIVIRQGGIIYSGGILYSSLAIVVFGFLFRDKMLALTTSLVYLAGVLLISLLQSRLVPAPEMLKGNINLIFTTLNATWISVYILWVIFDVIDRRARDEKQKNEKLKEVDELKTRLFTNITHEFRTPLSIIMGAASPPEKGTLSGLSYEGKGGRMDLIRNNANKLLRLVNQMLNLSRIESGTMKTSYVQMDIIPFLAYLMDSCRSLADRKGVKLHFLKGQDSLMMDVDPDKTEDIILNLVYNAIKFTPQGGDVYLTTVLPDYDKSARSLVLRIRDTGIGISEENLGLIFERFFQVEDSHLPVQEGSGIGLTLVREYLRLLGGTVDVSSKVNEGTEFTVTLPVTNIAEKTAATFSGQSLPIKPDDDHDELPTDAFGEVQPSEPHTILIVEDNAELAHYLRSVIAPHYHTEVAINGQDGVEKAMASIPDLIISDVMMPVKDGYELCDTLKKDYKTNHIPIILLTARADTESRIEGLKKGADDYISKPFQSRELLVRIRKMIEQREKLRLKYSLESSSGLNNRQPALSLDDRFIGEVLQHLEQHYSEEEYGIDDLCRAMHISRVQLHRKLVAVSGLSASHFISKFRVDKAAKLLESTRMTVSEAAFEVGFHDANYFSRIFSKIYGISPGDYRKQKQ